MFLFFDTFKTTFKNVNRADPVRLDESIYQVYYGIISSIKQNLCMCHLH